MKYPNASKGLKRILTAEFIALIASIIAVIVSVFALPSVNITELNINSISINVIVMLIGVSVLYIIAYIMGIFGIMRASKDEPAFKVSLYALIASIILAVLSSFFYGNETVEEILSIFTDVAQFFLVHYIIHGIMHLSEHLGRHDVSKKGKIIFRVIYIGIIFEVIVRVIEIIYGKKNGEELAMPFEVVANIMKTAEYVLFLIYIVKGKKLLKESKDE